MNTTSDSDKSQDVGALDQIARPRTCLGIVTRLSPPGERVPYYGVAGQ